MSGSFGFIIATHPGDYHMAKGCCASLRHFCGDVPLCVITDGDLSGREVRDRYGATVIRRADAHDAILRDRRSPTKMIAFWESPWERFFYLDADTVVWGDVSQLCNDTQYDMIVDEPEYTYSEADIRQWFFDGQHIERLYPDFAWRTQPYFCAGVFASRRGVWSIDEYAETLDLKQQNPDLFFGWDQGFLNLMVFRAASEGRLKLGSKRLQVIVPDYPVERVRDRFRITENGPLCEGEPIVIHWPGPKPSYGCLEQHSLPMDFFRVRYLRDPPAKGDWRVLARLRWEDAGYWLWRTRRRLQKRRRRAVAPAH